MTRLTALLLLCLSTTAAAQAPATSKTRPHVEFLASDALEGREAGSPGERLAADYLAAQLSRMGARPLPGQADMFMPFAFTAGSRDGGSSIRVGVGASGQQPAARTMDFSQRTEIQALSFSDDAEVAGPVVFAGYGIVVPESQNFGYDSYATLDVKDKIVVVLRYFPEDADQQTRAILARYSDLRYKAMAARQRGARALLVVTGPRSPNAGELVPMSFDTAIAGSGIPAASISWLDRRCAFLAGAPSPRDSRGTGCWQPACRRLRPARRHRHPHDQGHTRTPDGAQRHCVPAGDGASRCCQSAVGRHRRALRSPRSW